MAKRHPAKYSDVLLPELYKALIGYGRVLDPFAGTGKLRTVRPDAHLLEIEPEWAEINQATVGDAHNIPWPDNFFDAICTSPCYGNRMADHHEAKDSSRRNTYRHALERPLHPNNAGQLQWGEKYREFHRTAWSECHRVLRPMGRFILNISNHIRKGEIVPVSEWHVECLSGMGFETEEIIFIETPRQRQGQNGTVRVDTEKIFIFKLK